MNTPSILVAGVGNVFFGDDGFGVEVVRRLVGRPLPPGVKVRDFGIRGLDFAYALLENPDLVILVDAAQRGFPPGTVHVLEPDLECTDVETSAQAHGMAPVRAIAMARAMGASIGKFRVVACEPATLGPSDLGADCLSPLVAMAVDEGIRAVEELIENHLLSTCMNSR